MADNRFAEALMALGDNTNQAFGGKQNIYGSYQEQKKKRMELEAQQEAARAKLYNQSIINQTAAGTSRPTMASYDPQTGLLNAVPNPNYIAPTPPMSREQDILQKERKTYAGEGFLPISRNDLPEDPISRMKVLRGEYVRTSPDTKQKYMLGPEEMRRQTMSDVQKIKFGGRTIDPNDTQSRTRAEEALGYGINDAIDAGFAEPVKIGGKNKIRVLSERDIALRKKAFSNTETDAINSRYDVAKSFKNIKDTLGSIGDLPKDKLFDKVEFDKVDTGLPGIGVISIPARINLVGQYAKDPKYTAVKRELESAFQAYRKVVTGAQASAAELSYLRNIFPQLTDKPEVFLSTIDNILQRNGRELETRLNTWSDVGRDVTKLRDRYENEYKTTYGGSQSGSIKPAKDPMGLFS